MKFRAAVERLLPAYFALVMATGIVSIAAHNLGMERLSIGLYWVNLAAYVVLWGMTIARLVLHPAKMIADLANHARGPGFFTVVAGTCVLGVQTAVLRQEFEWARALWYLGIALWVIVTYGFFSAATMKSVKPSLAEGLNPTWLIAVVATQSIAVLGCLLPAATSSPEQVLAFSTGMHMAGFMLYLPLITLLLYRWMFLELSPLQLTPPYWINMGALAISALAGARLLQAAPASPLLESLTPFLMGTTLFCWASATWWIPLLLVLGFWRHVVRRVQFVYDPQYWGMVFPLGMYTVCTVHVSQVLGLPELLTVARIFVWPALGAWALVFGGLLLSVARSAKE